MKSSSRRCSQSEKRAGGGGGGGERLQERRGANVQEIKSCLSAVTRKRRGPASDRCDGMRLPATPRRLLNIPLWIPPRHRFSFFFFFFFVSTYLTRLLRSAVWRSADPVETEGIGAQQITGMGASALPCAPLSLSHMFKTQVALCNSCQRRVD